MHLKKKKIGWRGGVSSRFFLCQKRLRTTGPEGNSMACRMEDFPT